MTDWSPDGKWIAHRRADGLHLTSADGTSARVFATRGAQFRFSHDGSRVFVIRRGGQPERWELAIWDVATGRELRSIVLPLATTADVDGLTLSRDGSRIILGAGTGTADIWFLEGFDPPATLWARWFSR